MSEITLTDLCYVNAERTHITMTVRIAGHPFFDQPQPFNYVPEDDAPVTLLVREALEIGVYDIAPYVPPRPPPPPPPAKGQSSVITD